MIVTHHRRCGPSGRLLASALADVESDLTLNWGSGRGSDGRTINKPSAVRLASDKAGSLLALAQAEVRTLLVTSNVEDAATVTQVLPTTSYGAMLIGRSTHHRGGSGMWFCAGPEDVRASHRSGATHWLKAIDAVHEYRVHVVGRKVIKTSEKLGGTGVVRSKSNGWTFHTPTTTFDERRPTRKAAISAVKALGLDFGAVDILVDDRGTVYVLEVNTAPSLTSDTATTLDRYVEAITALVS